MSGLTGGSTRSSFRAARTDLEPVVTQLILPVLTVELPLEVLVVDEDRLFLVRAGDPVDLERLGRQLLGLGVQDLELDLRAVASEGAELAREPIDAVTGDLAA